MLKEQDTQDRVARVMQNTYFVPKELEEEELKTTPTII